MPKHNFAVICIYSHTACENFTTIPYLKNAIFGKTVPWLTPRLNLRFQMVSFKVVILGGPYMAGSLSVYKAGHLRTYKALQFWYSNL